MGNMNDNRARRLALRRYAEAMDAPEVNLVAEKWRGTFGYRSQVWSVRDTRIEPPMEMRIAVTDSGRAFLLNLHRDANDFLLFWRHEKLGTLLQNKPEQMASVLMELRYGDRQVVRDWGELRKVAGDTGESALAGLRGRVTPPSVQGEAVLQVGFWTHSNASGNVECWRVVIGMDGATFENKVEARGVGSFLPRL